MFTAEQHSTFVAHRSRCQPPQHFQLKAHSGEKECERTWHETLGSCYQSGRKILFGISPSPFSSSEFWKPGVSESGPKKDEGIHRHLWNLLTAHFVSGLWGGKKNFPTPLSLHLPSQGDCHCGCFVCGDGGLRVSPPGPLHGQHHLFS